MFAQLPQENIWTAFWRWEEDRYCTFGLGGDWKVRNDLHTSKVFQLLEVFNIDHETGYVYSLAVAIVSMKYFSYRLIIALRSKNDAFSSIGLSD